MEKGGSEKNERMANEGTNGENKKQGLTGREEEGRRNERRDAAIMV